VGALGGGKLDDGGVEPLDSFAFDDASFDDTVDSVARSDIRAHGETLSNSSNVCA
jgi:hypothetical protein